MEHSGGHFDGPDREAFKAALFHGAILELRQSTSWKSESLFVRLTGAKWDRSVGSGVGGWLMIEVESVDGQPFTGLVRFDPGRSSTRVQLHLVTEPAQQGA